MSSPNRPITTEQANVLKNSIFLLLSKRGYEFKPKNAGYLTSDESTYIRGLSDCRELIFDLIDEQAGNQQ